MSKYETVIGIEVHVELNTKTKMFCGCLAQYFGEEPNTHTCPVCLGLPGALPVINEEAIKKCIQIGLALNCEISPVSYFERKNYFYPDLSKGFQTSQLVLPVAVKGWLDVEDKDGKTSRIRINRAHQEEDTAKLIHGARSTEAISNDPPPPTSNPRATLIDYNRCSVPLVEIVTEPDFKDPYQVRDYAKKLQQIFRYLGVSSADMEKGEMRLEANVSVRRVESQESRVEGGEGYLKPEDLPPYRVELKNINSFRFMIQAVEYEIDRQIEALEKGEKLAQETRGYNEEKRETYVQRSKEDAHDYRYFPEPDLPLMEFPISNIQYPISNSNKFDIDKIKQELPELPAKKILRYIGEMNLKPKDAGILVEDRQMAEFFEQAVEYGMKLEIDPQQIANFMINQKIDLVDSSPKQVVDDIVAKKSNVMDDDTEIERMAKEAIDENPGLVSAYKSGKTTVIQALVGQVMRKSQGKANAQKVLEILSKLLS